MKKILILSSPSDEGEDVAAANLREALEQAGSGDLRLETVDLLDSSFGRFDGFLAVAFNGSGAGVAGRVGAGRMREILADLLHRQKPDVVVAACAFYVELIAEIYRSGRTRDFILIGLAMETAPEASASRWSSADYLAVANDAAAGALVEAGVSMAKIKIFGFPLRLRSGGPEREAAPPDLAGSGRPRILYLINTARKKAPKLLGRLLEQPGWDVTACVGDDLDVEEMARAVAANEPERLEVVRGGGRELPDRLRRHHIVISRASTAVVREAIAARCPLVGLQTSSAAESANLAMLTRANAGVSAEKPRDVVEWLERAFRDHGRLLGLWRTNLGPLSGPDGARNLARFVLEQADEPLSLAVPELRALPAPDANGKNEHLMEPRRLRRLPKQLVLCDLHTHTTWSDGKLSIPEMVDFYGQRGFDCLCITDHLCDPARLLGRLVNLTGLVIPPGEVGAYFEAIEREKKRAWAKYDLLLMAGVEFNKDGYTAKTSTHLLGVDLQQPIDPSLDLKGLISAIQAQGALAIASHPHEMKSSWGKDTLYLWENIEEYAPLLDAWEVANRDDIFNPVGLKKLPFIASSDFHKPKHIRSWKTVLYCEKEAEAIKHCIRVNRDVSLVLYRDQRFGLEQEPLPRLEEVPQLTVAEGRG